MADNPYNPGSPEWGYWYHGYISARPTSARVLVTGIILGLALGVWLGRALAWVM